MVLRVQQMLRLGAADRLDDARVAVATPLRWQRKFSAMRSAVSMPRAGPAIVAMRSPGTTVAPSGRCDLDRDRGIDQAEGEQGEVEAGHDARLARDQRGRGLRVGRHDGVGREVAGAAEILQQRRADQRLDHDQRERARMCIRPCGGTLIRSWTPADSPVLRWA